MTVIAGLIMCTAFGLMLGLVLHLYSVAHSHADKIRALKEMLDLQEKLIDNVNDGLERVEDRLAGLSGRLKCRVCGEPITSTGTVDSNGRPCHVGCFHVGRIG